MQRLKTIIASTRLFTDAQKVALLARLDELPEADKTILTQAIEEFDASYGQAFTKLKGTLEGELAGILSDDGDVPAVREAVERVRTGIKTLTS